jgi:transcriptional regulator with XRE-family HTH domain
MGRTSAPPLDGQTIRQARLRGFMTQAEVAEKVAEQCAAHDIKFDRSSLSLIENGRLRWPHPKVVPVLAEVLGMTADQMYKNDEAA